MTWLSSYHVTEIIIKLRKPENMKIGKSSLLTCLIFLSVRVVAMRHPRDAYSSEECGGLASTFFRDASSALFCTLEIWCDWLEEESDPSNSYNIGSNETS